jgi:hypothetical protein
LKNYAGTILIDTARRSEAFAPAQQHAQVEDTNTMMSYGMGSQRLSSDAGTMSKFRELRGAGNTPR